MIAQAKAQLNTLEQNSSPAKANHSTTLAAQVDNPLQSDLFAAAPSPIEEAVAELDPDNLTPKQALDLIYSLKSMI